jgi:hypothetical protein
MAAQAFAGSISAPRAPDKGDSSSRGLDQVEAPAAADG